MNPDSIVYTAAVWIIPLVIAIVFHEVAHGLMARALGDPTAADLKRLSFNPLRHVDPVGTVILPLALALAKAPVFGWAKPVPVDGRRLRNPRWGMVAVALAGPGMNFALAAVAAVALGLISGQMQGSPPQGIGAFLLANLFNFLLINIFLAVFNLLPLPPFDGGHVVQGILPRRLAIEWSKLARFGFPLIIILLVVVPMIWPSANIVEKLVGPPADWVIRQYLDFAQAFA
ncbi:site-2 protease family protein [Sphingomonas radiodurans]|uniref:site-2 protease family protein n=1 Tax=Sphingomonas radiodurans TaxID=2890321 RepID=UPI001E5B53E9|nr:site-2 protease family protein [Sphingomonas radiodurans]WBH17955.1 site-2 protease family protein [Sphingomonas radiodurans]